MEDKALADKSWDEHIEAFSDVLEKMSEDTLLLRQIVQKEDLMSAYALCQKMSANYAQLAKAMDMTMLVSVKFSVPDEILEEG